MASGATPRGTRHYFVHSQLATEGGGVGVIVQIDEHEVPWAEYEEAGVGPTTAMIRYKALTSGPGVPPVQYVEYPPDKADDVHSHGTGELFVVTQGELWLDGRSNGVGSVVFIPSHTDYAAKAGSQGARFFRIVV